MSLVETLKRARAFVAAGWSEPSCRNSKGFVCGPDAEDVERYCVLEAINHSAGPDFDLRFRAWNAVESVISPRLHVLSTVGRDEEPYRWRELLRASNGELFLNQWLEAKGRHPAAVLRAFDIAILRVSALERATRGAA